MRSNQRWLMTVVAILVIVSFIWFFSDRAHYRPGNDEVGSIYGQPIINSEFDRAGRQLRTAMELGLTHLVAPDLTGGDMVTAVTNTMVVRHEADALGIEPTDAEVEDTAKKIPAFQTAGAFDPAKYADFIDKKLGPRGFSDRQIDDLVRADLQAAKLRDLIESTTLVSSTEIKTTYEQAFGKTDASAVRWKLADFTAGITPTDDEIKKYFDEQTAHLEHPEKRKVQYVVFGLPEDKNKLAGKERVEAMKPEQEKAEAFLEKLVDAKGKEDFAAFAKEAGVEVKETPEFEEAAPAGFAEASVPRFASTAFHLSKDEPDSDAIDTPTAYYILHLSGITPARPMTIDEAKPKIVEALKQDKAREALNTKADAARTKIDDALKAGKLFDDAAKEAGVTSQDLPGFSPAEPAPAAGADFNIIEEAAAELPTGELGKVTPTPEGSVLVYVRRREPIDPAKFAEKKNMITDRMGMMKRRIIFSEWLRASRKAADIRLEGMVGAGEES